MNNAEHIAYCTQLQKELREFEGLTDVAFASFEKCSLKTLTGEIQEAWMKISNWSVDEDQKGATFAFDEKFKKTLENAFMQVSEAKINRKEFTEMMQPYIQEAVEYGIRLAAVISEKKKDILKAYKQHLREWPDIEDLLNQPSVMDSLKEFLQKETPQE